MNSNYSVYLHTCIYIYIYCIELIHIPTVQYMLYPPPEAILDSGPGVV